MKRLKQIEELFKDIPERKIASEGQWLHRLRRKCIQVEEWYQDAYMVLYAENVRLRNSNSVLEKLLFVEDKTCEECETDYAIGNK